MKLKDRVLEALERQRGTHISGEELAKTLAVSRNAIWKAVRQLQEAGHEIHALPKRGYSLSPLSQALSAQSILRQLDGLAIYPEVYPELDSTNTLLRQMAEAGAPEGTLIVTERQTAGKGRFGRSFHSPSVGGIYMSLLLRPHFSAQDALCITTCAAVAVSRALERHCGVHPQIKWVNDVFCAGKKVCGISTEGSLDLESGGLHYAVLGIGINLFPSPEPLPAELQDVIGTVLPEAPKEQEMRSLLIAEILRELFLEYPRLTEKCYFEDYRSRCFLLGRPVTVIRGETRRNAQALELLPDFSLLLRYEDGSEEAVSSGEVSIRETLH